MDTKPSLWQRFRKQQWSPWVCGSMLGVASVACLLFAGHRLGAIGGFETAASYIAHLLGLGDTSTYFTAFRPPQLDDRILIYIGIIIGALIGAVSSKSVSPTVISSDLWKERFGGSVAKRWGIMFGGCLLVALGAGIAGGCTSGMGVSGIMQLAPAGVVFFAAAFAVGIVVVLLLYGAGGKGGNQ